jgi:acyl carrier protein
MNQDVQLSKAEITAAIVESVRAVAPDAQAVGGSTRLLGDQALLDSVGFVTLLVGLEQRLGNGLDLWASFMEQDALAETDNPFLTVASLAEHIERLIAARA